MIQYQYTEHIQKRSKHANKYFLKRDECMQKYILLINFASKIISFLSEIEHNKKTVSP